jgi:hypothetical protein
LHGITSTITLLEISVRPLSLNREDIARKYEALLVNFPNLDVVDIDAILSAMPGCAPLSPGGHRMRCRSVPVFYTVRNPS